MASSELTSSQTADGSNFAWIVPGDGANGFVTFYTASQGGSNPDSFGLANLVVVARAFDLCAVSGWSGRRGLACAGGRKPPSESQARLSRAEEPRDEDRLYWPALSYLALAVFVLFALYPILQIVAIAAAFG